MKPRVRQDVIRHVKQDALEIVGEHVRLQMRMLQEPAQVKVMAVPKNGNMEVMLCH